MAAPTTHIIYPINAAFPGTTNWGSVLDAAPTTATIGTGWLMNKTAANNYSELIYGTENASFAGTAQPSGVLNGTDAIVAGPFDGLFLAGTWNASFRLTAVTLESGQQGRVLMRIWKGANATGTGAALLTATAVTGTIITSLVSPGGVSTLSTSLPSFRVDNDYLFFELAWLITTAANKNNCDADFTVGTDTYITTTVREDHQSVGIIWSHDEYPAP